MYIWCVYIHGTSQKLCGSDPQARTCTPLFDTGISVRSLQLHIYSLCFQSSHYPSHKLLPLLLLLFFPPCTALRQGSLSGYRCTPPRLARKRLLNADSQCTSFKLHVEKTVFFNLQIKLSAFGIPLTEVPHAYPLCSQ